ncbi:MAG: tetratricopeptide repeat protein [Terracidiphilus sp.]|jgi:tetratricopeptide (TPR) repeat protein
MKAQNRSPRGGWTVKQALVLGGLCLVLGIAGGWAIHAAQRPAVDPSVQGANAAQAGIGQAGANAQTSATKDMKAVADAQAAPQLAKLKSDPTNPELLIGIGNIYYDAHQYPVAVQYYAEALKTRQSDVSVRTDMGTAYWFMGDADRAIAEFKLALSYAPTNPNTLFNLGLVELQGKKDAASALDDWQKLLAANPSYEGRDKVEQMMAEAKKQAGEAH